MNNELFVVGDRVEKFNGAYGGPGVVRGRFKVENGEWRYNVAHKIEGGYGELIHIYSPAQIRRADPAPQADGAMRDAMLHGMGIARDSEHIPLQDFYEPPAPAGSSQDDVPRADGAEPDYSAIGLFAWSRGEPREKAEPHWAELSELSKDHFRRGALAASPQPPLPVGWMAYPVTDDEEFPRVFAHTEYRAKELADECYRPNGYKVVPLYASPQPQTAALEWRPEWRKDCWGKERHALFVGTLYVGSVMQLLLSKNDRNGEWRGWFMDSDEGNETGWFETADEARASVEQALAQALAASQPHPDTRKVAGEMLMQLLNAATCFRLCRYGDTNPMTLADIEATIAAAKAAGIQPTGTGERG